MARENFIFGKAGHDITGAEAFAHFINYCQKNGHKSAWIVTPGLRQATLGSIPNAVGEAAAKRLSKGETIAVNGVNFTLKTEKTMAYGGGLPILAFWPDEKHLNDLDDLNDVPALFVVPWILKQTEAWSRARNPKDIFAPAASVPANLSTKLTSVVANPVVEQALKNIAGSINMATGLANQDDKKTVIDTFKILRAAGEHYTPSEVQAWLTQNGMSAKYAAEVAKVAADPSKFRATRANSFSYLPANALEKWREKVRANS